MIVPVNPVKQASSFQGEESDEEERAPKFTIPTDLAEQSDIDEFLAQSDEENIFNSEDDNEYYSAISDYESDSFFKPTKQRFINHYKAFQFRKNQDDEISRLANVRFLQVNQDDLFESDNSESESTTPIDTNFGFTDTFGELKSLEENFQKIIDENHKTIPESILAVNEASTNNSNQGNENAGSMTIDDFVDYSSEVVSSDEDSDNSQTASFKPSSRLLHYRHDEKHNLAFIDVSTFPVRYDPAAPKNSINSKKSVRALNRRAILSGKASEMVGTGMSIGEFNIF